MMKRLISLLLAVVLMLSVLPGAALAANAEQAYAADRLYRLELISGTGTDANGMPVFELDRAPTRSEAITILVKLLGKEKEASKGIWKMPFTDVPDWAKKFVAYAYNKGLTSGTSATTFGGDDTVTATQYLTFILKALGYTVGTDFQWDKAWVLSDKLGITDGRYNESTKTFTRGDVFLISDAALRAKLKGKDDTLALRLVSAGLFSRNYFNQVYGTPISPKGPVPAADQQKYNTFLSNYAGASLTQFPCSDYELIRFAFFYATINDTRIATTTGGSSDYITKANMDYILHRQLNKTLTPPNGTRYEGPPTFSYQNNTFYWHDPVFNDRTRDLAIASSFTENSLGSIRIEFDLFSTKDLAFLKEACEMNSQQAFSDSRLEWKGRGVADIKFRDDGSMYPLRYRVISNN